MVKTNAMRILDKNKVDYNSYSYEVDMDHIDGISVAHKISKDERYVFKTLVAQGRSKQYYVFVIPVAKNLDLKKAAKASGEKSIEMIPVKDINKITGYIRGGCSPIGMKKNYRTFIDISSLEIESIVVSAGKIGYQIELKIDDLKTLTRAEICSLTMDN